MKIMKICTLFLSLIILVSCKFYSFSGANIDPSLKSFSVSRVVNQAQTINPNLSLDLREELIDRLNKQTGLQEVSKKGDLNYSVVVENYTITPTAINNGAVATENRFQIGIKCIFTDVSDEKKNFEQSFTVQTNFPSTLSLQQAESQYLEDLIIQLVDNIFNQSLVNW